MSNETKRDVFKAVWNRLAGYQVFFNGWPRETLDGYKKRYDNALPDNLPVIPKAVSEYIKRQKHGSTLRSAIIAATDFHAVDDDEADWIFYHSDTFARAWLLGVWHVEGTGEIVKMEVTDDDE